MKADDTTLRPMLAHWHQQLRSGFDRVLLAACEPGAGVWDRWGAVLLLDTELRPVLRVERELVDAVLDAVPRPAAEQLWTLGELLEGFGERLCELGRSGQRAGDFARTAEKYRLALEYWCRAVEGSVGPLEREAAPETLVDRLEETAGPVSAV
jgi:hypothetical protein